MSGISVFDHAHYKTYLNAFIRLRDERGYKSKLAKALNCDLGYVSRVLNGDAQFSLEQADALNTFLVHGTLESQYFLGLVSKERAGTRSLRKHFETQLEGLLQQRLNIENRIQPTHSLSNADQARYYSSWRYAAVHLMLAIPEFQTADAISARLKLTSARVHEILDFLISIGLAQQERKNFVIGPQAVHLEKDSPFIAQHHMNWRMKAVEFLGSENVSSAQYSSVVSIGKKDLPKVKEALIQAIESIRKTVRNSEDEVVWCYNLDWFPVVDSGNK